MGEPNIPLIKTQADGTPGSNNGHGPSVACCHNNNLRTWVCRKSSPFVVLYETSEGSFCIPAYSLTILELACLGTAIAQALATQIKKIQ